MSPCLSPVIVSEQPAPATETPPGRHQLGHRCHDGLAQPRSPGGWVTHCIFPLSLPHLLAMDKSPFGRPSRVGGCRTPCLLGASVSLQHPGCPLPMGWGSQQRAAQGQLPPPPPKSQLSSAEGSPTLLQRGEEEKEEEEEEEGCSFLGTQSPFHRELSLGFLHQPGTSLPPALPARRGGEERCGGSGTGARSCPGLWDASGAALGTALPPPQCTSGSYEQAAPRGIGGLGGPLHRPGPPHNFSLLSAFNYAPNKSGLQENGSFVAQELICSRCSFPALNHNPQLGMLQLATAGPGAVSCRIRAPFGGEVGGPAPVGRWVRMGWDGLSSLQPPKQLGPAAAAPLTALQEEQVWQEIRAAGGGGGEEWGDEMLSYSLRAPPGHAAPCGTH